MTPRFFLVPYDSGQKGLRMGAGPSRIMELLREPHTVIESDAAFPTEIATTFELYRRLSVAVHECVSAGDFPVVLSGNCGVTNGIAAGLGTHDLAVLWFDAHGESMTPDTSVSGFLDGMAMSILNGRCFHALAASIPWFRAMPESRTMLVGSRDFSPGERDTLLARGVPLVEPLTLTEPNVDAWLASMQRDGATRLHVHIDLDVLDPHFGRANTFAADGGLSPEDILRVIQIARRRFTIAGLSLASYDPSCDEEGKVAEIAARIVEELLLRGTPRNPRNSEELIC